MATRYSGFEATWRLGLRWLLILGAVVFGFWKTWQDVWRSAAAGTAIGYVFVLPFLCACAAIGIAVRRSEGLPIHDRQTDKIVGTIGLLVALGIQGLLLPRYFEDYELMHLDVVAAWFFAFSSAVLMFGLRPVTRFWPAWLVGVLLVPLYYRAFAVLLGGSLFAFGFIMVVVASAAVAISVSRNNRRAAIGFACSVIVGSASLYVALDMFPNAPTFAVQLGPALISAIVVGFAFYFYERRHRRLLPLDRPVRPPSATNAQKTSLFIVAAAALMFLIPLPDQQLTPVSPGPPPTAMPGLVVPAGWEEIGFSEYDWPQRYYGEESRLARQTLRTSEPNPAWDVQNRPRIVQMDVLTVRRSATLEVYPSHNMYKLQNARVSPKIYVDLGRGIVAEMYTVVDDDLLLTWSNLNFVWVRSPSNTQRVSLISVDNHEPDAHFPEPSPSMATNGLRTLSVLFRGESAVSDIESEYKDRDMLETLGRAVVEAQQW